MLGKIRELLIVSVSEKNNKEFETSINRTNLARGKMTAATFIVLEVLILAASLIVKNRDFLQKPNIYYGYMYILMIIAMAVFLLIFTRMEKNVAEKCTTITVSGIFFTGFILLWCAGISLLDQLSSGQIIVYVIAAMAIAVAPIFKPAIFLLIYLPVHILFLALMPYFREPGISLFGNYVNSTTILIISWVITCMRYKSQVEDFNNRKIIREKKNELASLNRELQEANRKLEKLSQTDSLTGIFNRSVFDKSIKTEWDRCRRNFAPLSIIMIDIDFFKAYNDSYGHQAGDDCLRLIAGSLSDCAKRSSDIVTRYGGEEFAIIVPESSKESALELAEKMRSGVEGLNIPHGYSPISEYVTISLGVYTVTPSDKLSIKEFIETADKALYEAKEANRNNIVVA